MCLLYLPSTKDCLNFGTGTKSLYISHSVTNFYGTEIEISAGFWPFGSTEKKVWADNEQNTFIFLNIVLSTLKVALNEAKK